MLCPRAMATSNAAKEETSNGRRLLQTHNNNPWWLARNLFCLFLLSLVTTVALVKFFASVQHQPASNTNAMSSSASKIIVYGGTVSHGNQYAGL